MLPIATSTDSTYATTLVAFGVTETVMIVSTDFLSAPALSTPAKFWPLRLRNPTHGTERWTWDFLMHEGRPYLAKFLRGVRAATVCSPEADAEAAG